MMKFEKTIEIPEVEAEAIDRFLNENPKSEDECLSMDDTMSYTADFGNGIEVDVKCCGVDYDGSEDAINTAYCEAVLFQNGYEQDCVEGDNDFFGDWEFESDENEYTVHVIRSND